jgi:hypothetical protein
MTECKQDRKGGAASPHSIDQLDGLLKRVVVAVPAQTFL